MFGITRVSSGRCGAVSIDLDELITEHYGITRAEVALIAGAAGPGGGPIAPRANYSNRGNCLQHQVTAA